MYSYFYSFFSWATISALPCCPAHLAVCFNVFLNMCYLLSKWMNEWMTYFRFCRHVDFDDINVSPIVLLDQNINVLVSCRFETCFVITISGFCPPYLSVAHCRFRSRVFSLLCCFIFAFERSDSVAVPVAKLLVFLFLPPSCTHE